LKILIFLTFIFITFQIKASERGSRLVLIYNGPGACDDCADSLVQIIKNKGFQVKIVKPGELTQENFSKAMLYIQPGGSDRILDTIDALSSSEIQNLRNFVSHGGSYLGICAGGFLAGSYTDDENSKYKQTFGLIPTVVEEELEDTDSTVLKINWNGIERFVYYQSGPEFNIKKIPNAKSFGEYSESHHSMALIAPFGKGRVGLVGPHLEATKDWFIDDNLKIKGRLSLDLLSEFIDSLIE
jgi:glutamine amidotransferase-like uncharacterized protein